MKHLDLEPRITIGISTVRRADGSDPSGYLTQTIESVLSAMSVVERQQTQILIVNANTPPEAHIEVEQVLARHSQDVSVRFCSGHRNSAALKPLESSQTAQYIAWRQKLSLDFVATLRICRETKSDYILRLEDDVIAADHFVSNTLSWMNRRSHNKHSWAFLSLYSEDLAPFCQLRPYRAYAPALLFRNDQRLDHLVEYIEQHVHRAPVDWLLRDYHDDVGRSGRVRFPSLFQHNGAVSSLDRPERDQIPRTSPTFSQHQGPLHLAVHHASVLSQWLWKKVG